MGLTSLFWKPSIAYTTYPAERRKKNRKKNSEVKKKYERKFGQKTHPRLRKLRWGVVYSGTKFTPLLLYQNNPFIKKKLHYG
jgi:hypothetical protein